MPDLGQSLANWKQFLGRENIEAFMAPGRDIQELRDKFSLERVQFIIPRDLVRSSKHLPNFKVASGYGGINYGVNTSVAGILYARVALNGGGPNVDINLYTAAGASGLVASLTNVAPGATNQAFTAQNASGLVLQTDVGAGIAADATDELQIYVIADHRVRLKSIYTAGTEDDEASRQAALGFYTAAANAIDGAIASMKTGLEAFALAAAGNPSARGNEFIKAAETSLSSDIADASDPAGNVIRERTGYFPTLKLDMADETVGGTIDVIKRTVAAAAGVFPTSNKGKGACASHTPLEKCPAGTATFRIVKGVDTGDIGKEEWEGFFNPSGAGDDRRIPLTGLIIDRSWSGPNGLGGTTGLKVTRTFAKTGDGSDLHLAAATGATAPTVTGISRLYVDGTKLHWKVTGAGPFTFTFYKSSNMATSDKVAEVTGIAAAAAFTATPVNSTVQVTWKAGTAPVAGTTGTLDLQGWYKKNDSGIPDSFTIAITESGTPGLIQKHVGKWFDAELNSDTSGSETITDDYIKQGTFLPFVVQDN